MALFHDPICLIHGGKDGLKVTEEGIRLLETLQEPIAVVCLAGQYRTGKSFFLNQLTRTKVEGKRSLKGFQVGPTTESCTRGIWLWDPSPSIRNRRGEKILFMDTEGMASTDNDESYDAKIFSLGLLLSSLFVFNTMGVIDEAAIDRLFLVSELTKHICINTDMTNSNNSSSTTSKDLVLDDDAEDVDDHPLAESPVLAQHFPPFVWLLRDFILEMQSADGMTLSANEYLEKALEPREIIGNASTISQRRNEERNQIRESIRTLFTKRQCFTLVRPVLDESDLRRAFELDDTKLRPEFVEEMDKIRQQIFTNVSPKILFGQQINGPQMVHLVKCYTNTMNTGNIPDIKAAWEYVSDATNQNALTQAMQIYDDVLKKVIPPSKQLKNADLADGDPPNADLDADADEDLANDADEDLSDDVVILDPPQFEKIHKQAQEKALNLFKRISIEGPTRIPCLTKLKQFFTKEKTKYISLLQKKSTKFCEKLIEQLYQQHFIIQSNESEWQTKWFSMEDISDFFHVQQKLKELESMYDSKAQGPSKNKVFFQFLRSTICIDLFNKLISFVRHVTLRHQEEWTNEMQVLNQTHQSNETKWLQEKERFLHQMELLNTNKQHVEEKNQVLTDQFTKMTEQKDELTNQLTKMESKKDFMETNWQQTKNELTQIVQEKNQFMQENELTKQKLSLQIETLQKELSVQINKSQHLQKEKEDFIEQMAVQTSDLTHIQQELTTTKQELIHLTQKFNLQEQELTIVQENLDSCQVKKKNVEKELTKLKDQLVLKEKCQQEQFARHLLYQDEKEKKIELLTERVDRLTKQLGFVETNNQIEMKMNDMLTQIECDVTKEQDLLLLQEEKKLIQEKFSELFIKITTLPDFYQRQIFCSPEQEPDFFDALTQEYEENTVMNSF